MESEFPEGGAGERMCSPVFALLDLVHAHSLSRLQLFATPWPTSLLCPWNFPGKNTGVGCHFLLQGIFLNQGLNPCLLCLLHWVGRFFYG